MRMRAIPRGPLIFLLGAVVFAGAVTLGRTFRAPAAAAPDDARVAAERARAEMERLVSFVEARRAAGDRLPANVDALYRRWGAAHPGEAEPRDPYDGLRFGYALGDSGYYLVSSGPDGEAATGDDIIRRVTWQRRR